MRIAFDTNVILDAVLKRKGYQAAQKLIMAVATEKIEGVIAGSSVTDIYYIAKKLVGDEKAREFIFNILSVFDIASVDGEVCTEALTLPMSDYEDAVLAACVTADYIVTNDRAFLNADSPIETIAPAELLKKLETSEI